MGLGPSSIESRATHTVPNHDARAFPGGYGFFERKSCASHTACQREVVGERWLVLEYRAASFFAAVHVPSSFYFFYCARFGRRLGRREG